MLRKLTIISLCILLLFQAGGLLCFYFIEMKAQQFVQQELLKQNKNSETRIFTHQVFKRMRINAHELLIDGKMYDFNVIEKKHDQLVVHLISDNHEDEILQIIGQFLGKAQKDNSSDKFPKHIIQWLQTPYMNSASWEWEIPTFRELTFNLIKSGIIATTYKEILPMPPEA